MTDKFTLSLGQAHQLEFAFDRNGWTAAEVHKLCQGDVLAGVRRVINGEVPASIVHGEMVSIPMYELERLKIVEQNYSILADKLEIKEKIAEIGDILVEEVFTVERTLRLGFNKNMRTRLLNSLPSFQRWSKENGWENYPVYKLKELVQMDKDHIRFISGLSHQGAEYIEKVLADIGLKMVGTFKSN